jgi:hypothetical protein
MNHRGRLDIQACPFTVITFAITVGIRLSIHMPAPRRIIHFITSWLVAASFPLVNEKKTGCSDITTPR